MSLQIRDRIREFRRVPASHLRPNPKNWRTHSKAQLDALRGVLAEVGYAGASLARELPDGSLMLIDGHARAEVSGDTPIPVLVLDVTDEEADKVLATFDPLGAMAGQNEDLLRSLLDSVTFESDATNAMLDGLLVDADELPEPGGGGDDFDTTPAVTGETRAKSGDLWEIGGRHRLMVGDCADVAKIDGLFLGKSADMVWTDPPYGVSYVGKTKDALKIQNDGSDGLPELLDGAFNGCLVASKKGAAWYVAAPAGPPHWEFAKRLMDLQVYRQTLVWVKDSLVLGHTDYHYKHEPIFYGWVPGGDRHPPPTRDQTSVFEIDRPKRNEDHPTMKPIELVQKMIENSSERGEIVYDPFLGSGTTLIAAHRLGRTCYGCEIEPKYADVILKRAEAEGLTCRKL